LTTADAPSTARMTLLGSTISTRAKPNWPTWASGWMKWASCGLREATRTRAPLLSSISQT
jgi:hypothetical protein